MSSQKKQKDFKKLVLMGLAGGALVASQGLGAQESSGVNPESDSLYAAAACGGKSGCGQQRKSENKGEEVAIADYTIPGCAARSYPISRSYSQDPYAPNQGGQIYGESSSYSSSYNTYDRPQRSSQGYYVESRNNNPNQNQNWNRSNQNWDRSYVESRNTNQNQNQTWDRSNPNYGMQAQPSSGQSTSNVKSYNIQSRSNNSMQPYNEQGNAPNNNSRNQGNSQY